MWESITRKYPNEVEQLENPHEKQLNVMSSKKYRILTIDGGGIRGVLPATFLCEIEEQLGKKVVDYFDLIVGTSTGGIIALGLGLGLSAREIADFYVDKGPHIFGDEVLRSPTIISNLNRLMKNTSKVFRHAFSVKHDVSRLRNALTEVLQDRTLGESKTRLVIPAYKDGPYVFKTAHHKRLMRDYKVKAVDVALGTSAAPSYFQAHSFDGADNLIDGGVWANNPMGVAAVEACAVLGWDMKNVWMLSLGCSEQFIAPTKKVSGVKATCGRWALDIMFRGQDRGSFGTAKLLLGFPHERHDAIVRVNPTLGREFKELDDASIISRLRSIANEEVRNHLPNIDRIFFSEERDPFIPSYQ
ncbi:COG3621 Patatin [Sphingomonadaceae bacterium]